MTTQTQIQSAPATSQCPSCYGTGHNKRGGPCSNCKATGQLEGVAKFGVLAGNLGRAMIGLAFFGMLFVFAIALLVSIIIAIV